MMEKFYMWSNSPVLCIEMVPTQQTLSEKEVLPDILMLRFGSKVKTQILNKHWKKKSGCLLANQ